MLTDSTTSLQTRKSLLLRLRDAQDHGSWKTFFDTYWHLLYKVARRGGLSDADAQDVVQETVLAVAKQMPTFQYDPARGSFKHWLCRIVRRRISDHLRRVYREPVKELLPLNIALDAPTGVEEDTSGMLIELHWSQAWDQEWEQAVLDAAVEQVRAEVPPKHFQIFDYCVRQGWPAAKVASTLGIHTAQVYLVKHRVSAAVKRAGKQINKDWQSGRMR